MSKARSALQICDDYSLLSVNKEGELIDVIWCMVTPFYSRPVLRHITTCVSFKSRTVFCPRDLSVYSATKKHQHNVGPIMG